MFSQINNHGTTMVITFIEIYEIKHLLKYKFIQRSSNCFENVTKNYKVLYRYNPSGSSLCY